VRDLAGGAFIQQQRNAVLVGGTGTGKSHLAVAIAAAASTPVPEGALHRRRLVNRLEAEARAGRQGPVRGPATLPPGQPPLHAHLDPGHHQPDLCRLALPLRRRQDDCSTGSPSLRHHRDRQRKLARQEPRLITSPDLAPRLALGAHRYRRTSLRQTRGGHSSMHRSSMDSVDGPPAWVNFARRSRVKLQRRLTSGHRASPPAPHRATGRASAGASAPRPQHLHRSDERVAPVG
jgi:hypothetical protein